MMISGIAQIALRGIDQKMQRRSSASKVSISLCGGLAPNCGALASDASRQLSPCRIGDLRRDSPESFRGWR
jgi:hypothetical protein